MIKKKPMTNKSVQEFEIKFYFNYLDAVLDEKFITKTLEIENNTLPSSLTIEIDGNIKNFRLKPFKRQNNGDSFIENVYIEIK